MIIGISLFIPEVSLIMNSRAYVLNYYALCRGDNVLLEVECAVEIDKLYRQMDKENIFIFPVAVTVS